LEVASFVLGIAGKGDLWPSTFQDLNNLDICNVAHLVILIDHLAILIADSSFLAFWHHGITGLVTGTHIAVDACPTIFTVAVVA